ncbi:jg8075 [Pararge aegeria aegeria]|uniref:Jg8075 protein n=1 Tax=Pararge aegeria aegeria TaxID=348720 RepID=A0A8S4QW69_9NEOP|nr:jg8075 [Pararge aegeria aegeria]
MVLSWRALALLAALGVCASVPDTYYHNHFAVRVPGGVERVDDIARRHGFVNHGQLQILRSDTLASSGNVDFSTEKQFCVVRSKTCQDDAASESCKDTGVD